LLSGLIPYYYQIHRQNIVMAEAAAPPFEPIGKKDGKARVI
jgi:hypothetical protein